MVNTAAYLEDMRATLEKPPKGCHVQEVERRGVSAWRIWVDSRREPGVMKVSLAFDGLLRPWTAQRQERDNGLALATQSGLAHLPLTY